MRITIALASVCLLVGCLAEPTQQESHEYVTSSGVVVNDGGSNDAYSLAMKEEDYARAEELAREQTTAFPDEPDSWLKLTYPLLLSGQFQAAVEACDMGLSLEPQGKVLLYTRGFIAQSQGDECYEADFEAARTYYEKAVEYYAHAQHIDPEYPDPYYGLAAANEGLGNDHEVIAHAERYLQLHPDSPMRDDALDMIRIAREYLANDRDQEASR